MTKECDQNCPESCPEHSGLVNEQEHTKDFIRTIKTNHLPHIQTALEDNTKAINDNAQMVKDNHISTLKWLIGVLVAVILVGLKLLAG